MKGNPFNKVLFLEVFSDLKSNGYTLKLSMNKLKNDTRKIEYQKKRNQVFQF